MLAKDTIQILTHCDPLRAIRACMMAAGVPPEIEVLCAVNGTLVEVMARLGGFEKPPNLTFIAFRAESVYPANKLRNVALSRASAEWVFYLDCDFVFCAGFWPSIWERCRSLGQPESVRICLCPAALSDPTGGYLTEPARSDILATEQVGTHRPPLEWPETGNARLFKFHEDFFRQPVGPGADPFDMTPRLLQLRRGMPGEPWGLLRRRDCAWADEDFGAGPLDKQQFVSALLDRGVRFIGLPDLFIFHLWHPEANLHDGRWPDGARNRALWARRYHGLSHRYLLIGLDGTLPDHLPAFLTDCCSSWNGAPGAANRSSAGPANRSDGNGNGVIARSLDAIRSGVPVVTGPPFLPRELLGWGYRVCLFFRSPVYYRARCSTASEAAAWLGADGGYAYLLARTTDLSTALSRIDNVALLCDLDKPRIAALNLQNVLGCPVPAGLLSDGALTEPKADETLDRSRYPVDYALYDYLRLAAGTLLS